MNISSSNQEFFDNHPKSKALFKRARNLFPDGVTHDMRQMSPFPIYFARTDGSHKWDVDGYEYICYIMGHGASILGYGHPAVVDAVKEQITKGSHYSGSHALEVELGELIRQLYPSVEKLRFVNSGTEATMLAIRLSRSYTNRPKIVKLEGNFHGWSDALYAGITPPFDQPTPGLPPNLLDNTLVLPTNDVQALDLALSNSDVAAVILEGAGAEMGMVPTSAEYARAARELCTKYGTVLIFDEVVTGFRWAPGGWQEDIGVKPDLSTMAKILMGALPGGCVAGKSDLIDMIQHRNDARWNIARRTHHPGTFNANPISTAAGIACLKVIATGEPHRLANKAAERLRVSIHGIIQERGVSGACFGEKSVFHIYLGDCDRDPTAYNELPPTSAFNLLSGGDIKATSALRMNLLVQGIDSWVGEGLLSMSHNDEDIDKTLDAFSKSLDSVLDAGLAPLRK